MQPNTRQIGIILCIAAAPIATAAADSRVGGGASEHRANGTPVVHRVSVEGCDVLVLWHTYRGSIQHTESQVRVRGAVGWTDMNTERAIGMIWAPPEKVSTNGRVYNWPHSLRLERCDLDRRYRFKVVAPQMTGEPVRSNEPYAGTVRWLYVPSSTGWTRSTRIDAGYLDLCVMDGTKCNKPYYPSGPTPILKW